MSGSAGRGDEGVGGLMPRAAPTPVETFSYLRRAPSEPPTTQEWAVAASAQLVDAVDPRPRGSTAAVRSTIEYLAAYAVAVGSAAPSPWLTAEQRRLALVSELTGWHVRVDERRVGVRQLVTSLARRRSVLGALVHHPQRPWLGPVRREGDAILADITLDLEQRNAELWLRLVGWCRDLRRAVAGAGTPAMRGDGRRAIPDLDRGVEGDDVGRDVEDDDVGWTPRATTPIPTPSPTAMAAAAVMSRSRVPAPASSRQRASSR